MLEWYPRGHMSSASEMTFVDPVCCPHPVSPPSTFDTFFKSAGKSQAGEITQQAGRFLGLMAVLGNL